LKDGKEPCLVWRTWGDGRKTAYYRQIISGRERRKSLGELAPDDARALVRKLRRAASLDDIERRLGFAREVEKPVARVAELLAAYDSHCAGADLEARTAHETKNAFLLILRRALDGGCAPEAAPLTAFTVELLREFAARTFSARRERCRRLGLDTEQTREALASCQRTIRSTVRQARSLFSREAMQSRAYAALGLDGLPGLPAALGVSLGESSTKPYDPLPAGTVERIGREAAALKTANPALWLAFQLEINAGLRRGSVVAARWDWFADRGAGIDGGRWIDLCVRVAKGRNYTLRIDPAWYDELLAVRAAGGGARTMSCPARTRRSATRCAPRLCLGCASVVSPAGGSRTMSCASFTATRNTPCTGRRRGSAPWAIRRPC
jgi:integrase